MNEFIVNASAEKKAALGKELGIKDWSTLQFDTFQEKASAYRESGKAEAYRNKIGKIKQMQEIAESKPKKIPRVIAIADGAVQRYADADSNFAVARTGDTFLVYDYATGNITRDMTRAELNAELTKYRNSKNAATSEVTADMNENKLNASEDLSSDTENYKKRLSAWDGVTEGFAFVLGDTSAVLKDIEVDGKKIGNKQIRLDATKAKSILKNHSEMDIDVLKSLPEITENPIIALESKTQRGRLVLFGEVTGKNGKPVMVAIELNPKTRSGKTTYLDIIKIASAYTRTNTQNLIDTSKIIYVDKKSDRVANWLKVNRLQLPLPNQQSNSVNNSIPDSGQKVNTESEKSAKTSFAEQLPMEKKAKPTAKQIKEAAEIRKQDAEMEALAKEKIKDYAGLSKANQSMIRKVLREAKANGISKADALSYARVAARTGLDITFDKKACYKGKNEAGEDVYHAGFYDPDKNRIVVNPETKRKHASLLIHELSHAIRSYIGKDGKRHAIPMIDDPDKISDAMWEKIEGYYADQEIAVDRIELMADEASAYYAEQILGTDAAIELLLGEKPTLKQKILSFFKKAAQGYSADASLSKEARKHLRNFKKTFDAFTARNYGRNAETGLAGDKSARRFAAENTPKITADMTDKQRYEALKDRKLFNIKNVSELSPEIKEKIPELSSWDDINNYYGKNKKKIIKAIAREFGAIEKEYFNTDIELSFEFSNGNFNEAYKRQKHNFEAFAKMFSVFDDVVESAVGVEIHNNINHKYDPTLENVYVLMSAYQDGDELVPIKLEVKKFKDKQNTLYVAVSMEKIKMTELYARGNTDNGVTQLTRSVNISIANIFSKINPSDKSFLKYIPNNFLNNEQMTAKREAIKEANDSDYLSAVERGDMVTAQRMVDEAANEAGYTDKVYHGTDADFTVFEKIKTQPGYWFTESKEYASQHGDKTKAFYLKASRIVDDSNIWDYGEKYFGADVTENQIFSSDFRKNLEKEGFEGIAFDHSGTLTYIVFSPEQIKSADPVTYDDNGNVIPLSERFNPKKSDIRFSMEEIDPAKMGEPTLPRTAREAGRKLISDGRYKQLIAGYLKGKSYSKKDAMSVINSLPLAFMIKGVSREKMAQAVWQVFNESVADKRMTEGQIKILARDLAEFFVSNLMIATIETPNAISAREAISNLKRGIASLEISASERLELQNSVKKADLQRILARWKFKMNNAQGNKNPISIASFIENLAKEVPEMGFSTESNPVQTLIVIDAIYQQSDNKKTKNIA